MVTAFGRFTQVLWPNVRWAIQPGESPLFGSERGCDQFEQRLLRFDGTSDERSNDADDEVRKAVAEVAPRLREKPLRPFAALLEALIDSPVYEHATPQLLLTLQYAPDKVDDLVLKAAQRFLSVYGAEAADIRTGAAGDARYISELVVRGLAQSRDRAHRAALLDVLDDLLTLGVYGVGDAIADFERL